VLNGGSSYPAITVIVNVASTASSPLANSVSVSGGGATGTATASDSTIVTSLPTANPLTIPSANGALPGGTFSIPVTLTLSSGIAIDALTFGIQITPVGGAPVFTSPLTFTAASSISQTPVASTGGTDNVISVLWYGLSPGLSGTLVVGTVSGTVPAAAALGQSYTVAFTGVGATNGGGKNLVPLAAGPNGTLTVSTSYLVGDVYPYTGNMAPNFGDPSTMNALNRITILDAIQILFAVNNVPGFVPTACSDRFDAMDTYPEDTATTRGGDGVLDIRDLIQEIWSATSLDTNRWFRASRGACTSSSTASEMGVTAANRVAAPAALPAEVEGALLFGRPEALSESQARMAVYLEARRDLAQVALTFALGDRHSQIGFVPAAQVTPSLAPASQGVAAVAWLGGVSLQTGARLLLGYVEGPAAALPVLQVYGVSAVRLVDNTAVRFDAPNLLERSR